jgi:hypothetical protein
VGQQATRDPLPWLPVDIDPTVVRSIGTKYVASTGLFLVGLVLLPNQGAVALELTAERDQLPRDPSP